MLRIISVCSLILLLFSAPALGGDSFPDLPLTGTLTAEQSTYLAQTGDELKPSTIGADFLFVEVYSMYCPICQRDAPLINELYEKVVASELGKKIRFIGIGAGNTPFEVDFYRKKFAVAFPLFEDPQYVYHKALGEVGTPAFYLVDLKKSMAVLYFHEGAIEKVDAFMDELKKLTAP